jgi:O-antigen/teichoic acid export membrane protein
MRVPRIHRSLTVNAAALMTGTIATNALGLVFWAAAAHLRPAAIVGRAAAGVAALTLLATISQLNLTNVFVRLLPAAGRFGRQLVARGYLAVIAFATAVSVAYVTLGLGDHFLSHGWLSRFMFVVAVNVLVLFALQDAVLTALRLSPFVPLENISSNALRVALVPVLLALPAANAIALAWVIPAALAVIVVSRLLFSRVLPRLDDVEGSLPGRRRLLSFVAGEYLQSLFATVVAQLMPLVILWRLGPSAAAYFTLPWLISMGITLLLWNVASSFVVEVTSNRGHQGALLRRSLLLWGAIVLGALVVCVLGARPLLALAGGPYAEHGAGLLRLIGAAVPLTALSAICCTLLWLDQRVWLLAGCQLVAGLVLLGTTLGLTPHLGLMAVGVGNVISQAVIALALLPVLIVGTRSRPIMEAT